MSSLLGQTSSGETVELYALKDSQGMEVGVSTSVQATFSDIR